MSEDDSNEEMYSIKSSQTVYKRSHSRPSISTRETVYRSPDVPKLVVTSDERRESTTYLPVTKWAIDYNNKNYIRSKCNKNIGHHRTVQSRPLDYHIEYDNNFHTRSKVNEPKGLHRKKFDVKRKYAPERDDLADATGWEFDWGPEIDQKEQDILFIPEGIVSRGCYRWYGVRRNDSDCDVKQEEHRENLLNEELKAELKYGQEFLQSDIPHMTEREEKVYSKGGYRCYEAQRNVYDIKPELPSAGRDPEWRRKYHSNGIHYLDLDRKSYVEDIGSDHRIVKGKPFKRTVLNKVYELRKKKDSRDLPGRRATRLSLVPGEGKKTLYEGVPDRFPFDTRRSPSIRSVFKKKSERERYRSKSRDDSEYEEYERQHKEEYQELKSEYEDRLHRMATEKRRLPSMSIHDKDEQRLRAPSSGRFEQAYRAEREPVQRKYPSPSITVTERERDVRDEFETWRENAENTRREQERGGFQSTNSRNRERMRSESFRDYNRGLRRKNDQKSGRRLEKDHRGEIKNRDVRSGKASYRGHHDTRKPAKEVKDRSTGLNEYDGHESYRSKINSSRNAGDHDFDELHPEKELKKMPPHVEKRIKEINAEMERKFEGIHSKHKHDREDFRGSSSEDIDLRNHKKHPGDRGQSHSSEYEKYVTKNGSEYWIRKEGKYSELHHKNIR